MKTETPNPTSVPEPHASLPALEARELRRTLGAFATGVTVVATLDGDGRPTGFTANSFTSVSLEPPLILVCLAKGARSYPAFRAAGRFAVNILAEEQRDLSNSFATTGADKFAQASWRCEATGAPVLDGVAAWLDCLTHELVDAGDHVILIGRVLAHAHSPRPPLGYCRGTYIKLAMTAALDAAVDNVPLRVGAIVERYGEVLFRRDPKGGLCLPTARRMGRPGDADGLLAQLMRAGIAARPSFVYSVFESGPTQEVYYRAAALETASPLDETYAYHALDDATLASVADPAVRSMLGRYRNERARDLFGIYVGTHEAGDVRPLEKGDPL